MKYVIRVFNYLNISNAQNIWADSGFHLQRYTINYILRKRNDFFFYITVPHTFSEISKLGFERPEYVKLIPLKYSTRGSLNKLLIDLDGLKKNFKWQKYYVNVIFSNEPYLTHALVHVFKSSMPFYGTGVGNYINWIEVPELNLIKYHFTNPMMWILAGSILFSDYTFTGSNYGVNLVLRYVKTFLRDDEYEEVKRKLKPLYIGISVEDLDKNKPDVIEKEDYPVFVFPHRLFQYTGAGVVLKVFSKLLKEDIRKFKLYFTNPSAHAITSPYLHLAEKYRENIVFYRGGLPYNKYIQLLWNSDFVIAWHMGRRDEMRAVNTASIALLEAVACENYPIVHSEGFYPEYFSADVMIEPSEKALYEFIKYVIDNVEYYRRRARTIAQQIREKYDWKKLIDHWIKGYEMLYYEYEKRVPGIGTKSYKKVFDLINRVKHIKWSDIQTTMRWGHQIKIGRDSLYVFLSKTCQEFPLDEPEFNCGERVVEMKREVYEKKVSEPIIDKKVFETILDRKEKKEETKRKTLFDFT